MCSYTQIKEKKMAVSYNKLWHRLIEENISKTQLIKKAGISTNAMAHLGKNEDVRVEVLVKICETLNCSIEDIMEIVPEDSNEENNLCQEENKG